MARYEITKSEAEQYIALYEEAEAKGFTVQGFSFGDGKYYSKEFLHKVRDNGGFVKQTEPLTAQEKGSASCFLFSARAFSTSFMNLLTISLALYSDLNSSTLSACGRKKLFLTAKIPSLVHTRKILELSPLLGIC